jgi:hypothetical protein
MRALGIQDRVSAIKRQAFLDVRALVALYVFKNHVTVLNVEK